MRKGNIRRVSKETQIQISLTIEGRGRYQVSTGIRFFDHMLELFAHHGGFDLKLKARGDLDVDQHHTVEDVGIALGQALARALGEKRGVVRYADCLLPMDETLTRVALDLSGRPFLVFNVDFPSAKIGAFDTELVREFFQALSTHGGLTLHVDILHGANSHHIAESCFKGVARALGAAVAIDPRQAERIPSTKGAL